MSPVNYVFPKKNISKISCSKKKKHKVPSYPRTTITWSFLSLKQLNYAKIISKAIVDKNSKVYLSTEMKKILVNENENVSFYCFFLKNMFALIHLFISKRTTCSFRFLTQGDRNPWKAKQADLGSRNNNLGKISSRIKNIFLCFGIIYMVSVLSLFLKESSGQYSVLI